MYPTYSHILLIGVGPPVTLYDSVPGDRWEELAQVTAVSPAPLLLPHCWQVSQHWVDLININQPHDCQWYPTAWSTKCDQALLLLANKTTAFKWKLHCHWLLMTTSESPLHSLIKSFCQYINTIVDCYNKFCQMRHCSYLT